jgi:L-2-hydroxycarboxylate dehydrogenase (NAD+)
MNAGLINKVREIMGLVKLCDIHEASMLVLQEVGVSKEDASIIAATILDSHKKGRHTHGIGRLPIYVRKINDSLMTTETILSPIHDFPVVTVYDAHNGFGQVAGYKGMLQCVDKAASFGIGVVAIKDINSFGVAGYYGRLAAERGMIGVIMGNASPAFAPIGGACAILGTNPICFAFPGTEKYPHIVFDMACTVAARSKIRLAAKNGEKIPADWALDVDGNPTDDPIKALEGTINPLGGHKGFGLALVVDILSGLLTGSAFAGDTKALNDATEFSRCGCFLAAINPEFFLSREEYEGNIDYLVDRVKACGDPGEVLMPGENGYLHEVAHPDAVVLSAGMIEDVNRQAEDVGIALRL